MVHHEEALGLLSVASLRFLNHRAIERVLDGGARGSALCGSVPQTLGIRYREIIG